MKGLRETFDNKQQMAIDFANIGDNVFISGVGGTGKTFVTKKIIDNLRKKGKKVVVCAFTRKAALLIDDEGKTIYKAFNSFPNGLVFDEQGLNRLLKSIAFDADVIIIDEISMCPSSLFSYISEAIRRIGLEKGFKNIQLIVLGDFLQLPPITHDDEDPKYAFLSKWWDKMKFRHVLLDTPHRHCDPEFFEVLMKIRRGEDVEACIRYLMENAHYLENKQDITSLYACNYDVNKKNDEIIAKLPGQAIKFTVKTNDKSYVKDLPIREEMTLKVGVFVMAVYNDPEDRFYNGLTGRIVSMTNDSVTVEFDDSTDDNPHIVEIVRHRFSCDYFTYAEQIPIVPAYATTIHKAQGATLDYVNVDPRCFAEGQLYVALSRVKCVDHLYITTELKSSYFKVNKVALAFDEECRKRCEEDEHEWEKLCSSRKNVMLEPAS